MAKKAKTKDKKKGGGSIKLIFFMIICCVLAVFLKAAFMFLLLGLLPTIAAFIADTSKGREVYHTVLACNLAGLLPYAANLADSPGHGIESFDMLTNATIWLIVYAAAGGGWILVWACPHLAEFITDFSNRSRIARLEAMQKQLIEEWGPEIQRRG